MTAEPPASEPPAPGDDAMTRSSASLAADAYERLKRIAHDHLHRMPGAAIQPTELVHEAYLQLGDPERTAWRSRTQFVAIASRAMRDALVDQLRALSAHKRGGGRAQVTLTSRLADDRPPTDLDLLDVHQALEKLAALDGRQARIVELRFFGGLTGDEIAEVIGVSRPTVVRELRMAQAWLLRELDPGADR